MITHNKPNPNVIPGFYEPNIYEYNIFTLPPSNEEYQYFENVIHPSHVKELIKMFKESNTYENVSIHGLKDVNIGIGSKRTTMWSPELVDIFNKYYLKFLNKFKVTNEYSRTDSWQGLEYTKHRNMYWELQCFSPMFRFMSYLDGGEHYAHYDAAYIYPDNRYRTLSSVVIYLTTNDSGCTRFINDHQDHIIQKERKNDDFSNRVDEKDVLKRFYPKSGSILVFDHRVCHDVETFIPKTPDEERIIIRTDLIYKLV